MQGVLGQARDDAVHVVGGLVAGVLVDETVHLRVRHWLESHRRGEDAPTLREGRRMRWLETALPTLRKELPKAQWRRLQAALALTLSADAMVVMKDVCRLGDDESQRVLHWAALALLRAGLAEGKAPGRRRPA